MNNATGDRGRESTISTAITEIVYQCSKGKQHGFVVLALSSAINKERKLLDKILTLDYALRFRLLE